MRIGVSKLNTLTVEIPIKIDKPILWNDAIKKLGDCHEPEGSSLLTDKLKKLRKTKNKTIWNNSKQHVSRKYRDRFSAT